jgi:DNA-binding SARP family transcriptional activator
MLFSILGPLIVSGDDQTEIPLRQRRQRHLLVTLALHSPEYLPTERLADLIWGNESSASPGTVRTQVWALRREPRFASLIAHEQRGYKLDMQCSEIDADNFIKLSRDGMRLLAGADPERAAAGLGRALRLWREPLLGDIPETPGMAPVRDRLLTERTAAQDALITARLMLRQHHQVLGVLRERVAKEPEREQSWAQLMLALYRCGRRAEALDIYTRSRKELSNEYGIEPGPQLRRIHGLILRDDAALQSSRGGWSEFF